MAGNQRKERYEKKMELLTRENTHLRKIIGDLPVELKNPRVAGMRSSNSTIERNFPIVERIKEVKAEHPFWGYRRMWAYVKYME